MLPSSTPQPAFSDVRKTATMLNKRAQPSLNLHFQRKKHKGKSYIYKKALSAAFKHLGKTGVNRILFPLLLSEFAVKAPAEVCTQCASSMHTTAWNLAVFRISFCSNECARFHTKCTGIIA